jgi:3-deoxy-D-manno-octulosonic-acid transferase
LHQIALQLYSLLLTMALPLASPILLFVPKTRAGLKQKLGLIDEPLRIALSNCKKAIWIHAVSVGEFNGVFPLLQALKEKYPDIPLVVSTTTKAGQVLAKQRAGHMAQIIYFPFDLSWIVNRFLFLIDPSLVIIFETELWPNFIDSCWQRNIPVAILNARMSPRSFKRYKLTKSFFGPAIRKLALIGAQTNTEVEHYKVVGGDDLPIQVFGNLKYDWTAQLDSATIYHLKEQLGIQPDDLVLIGGSTHPEEEKIILDTYKKFLTSPQTNNGKKLKVIIAPRHPERFEIVAKLIENAGFKTRRYSKNEKFAEQNDIYLLDTIGQLANFYSIASLAFVGGSIAKVGGHNLLEPYLYAVPVVCGPHLFKTKETAAILDNEKALFIAPDAQTVENKLLELIQNRDLRKQMGNIGQFWLNNNRGAVSKALAAVDILLHKNKSNQDPTTITNKVEMITL